jgi:DNA-binding NarL/FixJ family response regulator
MNNDRYARNGTRNAGQQELLSYLGKLGLEQGDMAKCLRYLDDHLPDDLIQVKNSIDLTVGPVAPKLRNTASKIRNVGLYLAEEQQVLRGPYESYFGTHSVIKLLGSSEDLAAESLFTAAMAVNPDVILLGVKTLRPAMLESLNDLREEYSEVGLVLLVSSYDRRAFKSLRSLPIGGAMGTAYLLKHTIDTMEQVSGIIRLVAEGRTIVDPKVMAGLIDTEQTVEASRGAILNNLPAMDTWDVDPPVLESEIQVDADEAAGSNRPVHGNLEEACAVLENQGICIDRAVFEALVCLAASGLLSSLPRNGN